MVSLLVTFSETAHEGPCLVCGQPLTQPPGLQLRAGDGQGLVCQECGRQAAPALTALLNLALVAARVGRISHHSRSWVAMEQLLELTRAAESYFLHSLSEGKSA